VGEKMNKIKKMKCEKGVKKNEQEKEKLIEIEDERSKIRRKRKERCSKEKGN
jgi:hypothetical protein